MSVNRRSFVVKGGLSVVGISALGAATLTGVSNSIAQTGSYASGTDYETLSKPVAVDAPKGKVEVIEFFGYFCPHCNSFEPELEKWLQKLPADIAFKRVPVAFDPRAVPMQKLFYTLETLNLLNQYHKQVFAAVHVKGQNLSSTEGVQAWAKSAGLDMAAFNATYNSFSVNTKASKAKQLVAAYQVDGVPSFGVGGKFYTDGQLAKGNTRALAVVEHLAGVAKKSS